jgi:hypothetical protein
MQQLAVDLRFLGGLSVLGADSRVPSDLWSWGWRVCSLPDLLHYVADYRWSVFMLYSLCPKLSFALGFHAASLTRFVENTCNICISK